VEKSEVEPEKTVHYHSVSSLVTTEVGQEILSEKLARRHVCQTKLINQRTSSQQTDELSDQSVCHLFSENLAETSVCFETGVSQVISRCLTSLCLQPKFHLVAQKSYISRDHMKNEWKKIYKFSLTQKT
jgi:hypothetical protein